MNLIELKKFINENLIIFKSLLIPSLLRLALSMLQNNLISFQDIKINYFKV